MFQTRRKYKNSQISTPNFARHATPNFSHNMVALEFSSLGHQMRHMIAESDNGLHKCFTKGMVAYRTPPDDPYGGVMVTFGGKHHPERQNVYRQLSAFRAETGIRALLPFQIESVLNMVFRPTTIVASRTIQSINDRSTSITQEGVCSKESADDDIGMLAINDLFTGSGKTLTTMLAAIIFAHKRRREITGRVRLLVREQSAGNWAFRVHCPTIPTTPAYSNAVVVMCAKHLFSQWKLACSSALKILGTDETSVSVLENPLPGSQALLNTNNNNNNNNNLKIIMLHSVANLKRLDLKFVPVIVVDEFTVKSISNIMFKSAELLPLHGRMLLVSADAGSTERILHRSHSRSFLRTMLRWNDVGYGEDARSTLATSISLVSASVLPTVDRHEVGQFMVDQLFGIGYEKYTVKYTPSFASRLFGHNFEMSAISGSRLINDRFGIVLTGTKTVGELLRVVADTADTMSMTDGYSPLLPSLTQLRDKLRTFVGESEACPICMEEYDIVSSASLINPCWHIVCDKCLNDMMTAGHHRCPLCRTTIEGHTTAVVDTLSCSGREVAREESDDDDDDAVVTINPNSSLFHNMDAILEPTSCLEKACLDTLRCISADVAGRPYKIVMIVPDQDFFTKFAVAVRENMGTSGIDIIEFKTRGTKRKHVTGKSVAGQIASFASDEGPPLKILFTTEGKTDSLTGLDFPRVDCIMSLGDGNSLQRLGRLTRLPRMLDEAASKVRYVCFEPVL